MHTDAAYSERKAQLACWWVKTVSGRKNRNPTSACALLLFYNAFSFLKLEMHSCNIRACLLQLPVTAATEMSLAGLNQSFSLAVLSTFTTVLSLSTRNKVVVHMSPGGSVSPPTLRVPDSPNAAAAAVHTLDQGGQGSIGSREAGSGQQGIHTGEVS